MSRTALILLYVIAAAFTLAVAFLVDNIIAGVVARQMGLLS